MARTRFRSAEGAAGLGGGSDEGTTGSGETFLEVVGSVT
jgi:hypothetical protein